MMRTRKRTVVVVVAGGLAGGELVVHFEDEVGLRGGRDEGEAGELGEVGVEVSVGVGGMESAFSWSPALPRKSLWAVVRAAAGAGRVGARDAWALRPSRD